jgi:hypothetical protein
MPTLVLENKSLFDCLFQRYLDYHFLRTFRCLCFLFLRPYYTYKLEFCSSLYVFPGIAHLTLVTVVLTLHPNIFISLIMSVFMNMCFFWQVWTYCTFLISNLKPTCYYPTTKFVIFLNVSHHYWLHKQPMCVCLSSPTFCSPQQPYTLLSHHHMHVYLTILLQVHIEVWLPLVCSMIFCYY